MLNLNNIRLVAPYRWRGIKNASILECKEYLESKFYFSVDTETRPKAEWVHDKDAALDPYKGEIIMLQVGDEHRQYCIDVRYVNPSILGPLIESRKYLKIGQNLKIWAVS